MPNPKIRPMKLSKHHTPDGVRWALDGHALPPSFNLATWLGLDTLAMHDALAPAPDVVSMHPALPPIEPMHEVWASGVTYLRSRDARKAESTAADVYQKVYEAERPELFMKAVGWRAVTSGQPVRIRRDSHWNVPEPELVLVINAHGQIIGYTAGNDMSSRDIEGENPLYLPQAKIYDGACALGPQIVVTPAAAMSELTISLEIRRAGAVVFSGETSVARMKRSLEELASYLYRELSFPHGAFLMTGTGIVPPESFTLGVGDEVRVTVGDVTLENTVA